MVSKFDFVVFLHIDLKLIVNHHVTVNLIVVIRIPISILFVSLTVFHLSSIIGTR